MHRTGHRSSGRHEHRWCVGCDTYDRPGAGLGWLRRPPPPTGRTMDRDVPELFQELNPNISNLFMYRMLIFGMTATLIELL